MNYKNWLNEWLALYVKPTTKIRTYKKYQRQIELHILPVLGEFELNDLTATVLQRFTVDLSEKGLSANTVNGIITVSKSCHDSWENREYVKVIDEPKTESSMRVLFPFRNNCYRV